MIQTAAFDFSTITDFSMIECAICGEKAHFLQLHLQAAHAMSPEDYEAQYPGSPLLSKAARARLRAIQGEPANTVRVFNVKDTFGVDFGSAQLESIEGWESPWANTPEIEEDYHFRPDQLYLILYALKKRGSERLLFQGPTGSGKTSCASQVCAKLNLPVYRVNMDGDITRADFIGTDQLNDKATYFRYGVLPRAMREGAVLIVDEWDRCHSSISMALQAVLEGSPLFITETGEYVYPAPGFQIIATANTLGMGDESGLYNSATIQDFSQLDRFTAVEHVDYPEEAEERKIIIKKTGIECRDTLDKFQKFTRLVREAHLKGEIRATMSTRTVVNIGLKFVDTGSIKLAYHWAFINKLSGVDRQFCLEVLQRVWGTKL